MEQDENWRGYQISHVQAGIVAMENLLDDGDRDDAVYVLGNIVSIFDQLSASDELPDEVTDELQKVQEIVENAYLMTGRES